MPRFTDKWVIDKCMFDYVNGGDCACCGFPHLFMPGGIESLINTMSDLETDDAKREVNAARMSPWPPDMRDQIWSDRLLLRFKMKKEISRYRTFLEGMATRAISATTDGYHDDAMGDDGRGKTRADVNGAAVSELHKFCRFELTPRQLSRIFQLPRSELGELLKEKYRICSAYSVGFCSVVDQVANFGVTGSDDDARRGKYDDGDDMSEGEFERMLKYDRNKGFHLDVVAASTSSGGNECDWAADDVALMTFLRRMASLAGPTLLSRAARTANVDDDDDAGRGGGSVDDGNVGADGKIDNKDANVTSFRSDRRVIRLMIARFWADRLMEKYDEIRKEKLIPSPSPSITPPI